MFSTLTHPAPTGFFTSTRAVCLSVCLSRPPASRLGLLVCLSRLHVTCLSSPSAWAATADTPSGGFSATLLTGVGGARGPFAWRLRLGPCPVLPRQRPRFGGSALTTQSPPKGLLSKYRHTGGRGLHVAAGATDHLSEAVTCQDAVGLPANESGTPTPLQAPRPAPRDPDSATGAMSGSPRP